MSALSPPASPDDSNALRVVLFGMPDAGKSSLLGALAQAAHSQGRALHGNLADLSHGLGELRNRLYDDHPRETQQEIVAYPVRFDPAGEPVLSAVLYDCDGRTANDFLTRKRAVGPDAPPGTLAWAILHADVLILLIDAAARPDQVDADFREFRRFLELLERFRQDQHLVGGLPVLLVLTKCDLLAREPISRAEWEARIAERTRDVARRFHEFLAGAGNLLAFGTLNLEVRATAVRQPALTDAAPQAREPFGVAELFHEVFRDARVFRDRHRRARRRLAWTAGGAAVFLATMLGMGSLFLTTTPVSVEESLADRVELLRAAEGPTAADRLDHNLDRRLREWQAVQADPQYPQLPEALRTFVQSRLDEGSAYARMRDELGTIQPPTKARSLAELGDVERRLNGLLPPASYQSDWADTEVVRTRTRMVTQEAPALRDAVGKLTQFYFTLTNRAATALSSADLGPDWAQRERAIEVAERLPPFPRSGPVQSAAYEFDDVALARTEWEKTRDRLVMVRELATALGLIGTDPATAPLAPRPAEGGVLESASRRWQAVKSLYPSSAKWSLAQVPDPARSELERELRRSLEQSTRDGQRLILDKLKAINTSGKEEPADWPRIGEYLTSPTVADWRGLVGFLNHLLDPAAADPVAATAAFVRTPVFDLEPRRVRVSIPDTLSDAPVRPAGDLVLVHQKAGDEPVRMTLRREGEPERDKQAVAYSFAGGTAISYKPGDTFYAELPVKKGDRDFKFTWAISRTLSFQFEHLARPPRMHTPDQSNVDGLVAEGVAATVADGKFPAVPAMIPTVRFDGK